MDIHPVNRSKTRSTCFHFQFEQYIFTKTQFQLFLSTKTIVTGRRCTLESYPPQPLPPLRQENQSQNYHVTSCQRRRKPVIKKLFWGLFQSVTVGTGNKSSSFNPFQSSITFNIETIH